MSDPVGVAAAVAATKAEDTNQIAYWARRWQEGNTQWHKTEVHPAVLANATTLLAGAEAAAAVREGRAPASSAPTVLVPLCGKAVDMMYLYQQGFRVVGIEIVTQAIIDFFYSQWETFPSFRAEKIAGTPGFYRYTSGADDRLQIIQADIFSPQLTRELVGGSAVSDGVAAVWDRGSLVAIQPSTRRDYLTTIHRLCGPRTQILLNVHCYDQSQMNGPPFSVTDEQLAELLPADQGWTIRLLGTSTVKANGFEHQAKDYIVQK